MNDDFSPQPPDPYPIPDWVFLLLLPVAFLMSIVVSCVRLTKVSIE